MQFQDYFPSFSEALATIYSKEESRILYRYFLEDFQERKVENLASEFEKVTEELKKGNHINRFWDIQNFMEIDFL
jgi:hypothetical protein